ncbi:MAG: DUF2752 domain-containing protein [Candidatus Mcinerneyibacterium aminivorans]|uniref:DUF2752 domain-containing protein n=1 Tax=Candidatus Mcinerneyibacterium aminivorans TaxID=2703815 RepID=A0A5D0MKB2_9BACT|nr:MAG: DUF2752 domain-containing protein [Candidatus Mcinerneyibacterium aminivorans]
MKKNKETEYFPAGLIINAAVLIGGIAFYFFPLKNAFPCMFKEITNIPCPTCGGTRLYYNLLDLNLLKAFFYNPLIFLILIFLVIYSIHDILVLFRTIQPLNFNKNYFRYIILGLIILNWIYLIIMDI